ncbi:AI-2E family transporter [Desulfobotulus sp.]|jgi:putative permease|uniref:AI-2E family transporter n=1 Tax=Desulfobotulus sp. TaxID=1940337 RepID=UPI002A367DE1|nr:AI-2E family transporter [Desulfobotulus sp.]MDY0161853.1 AI-2E family transporter [Desulfobotulus sp.]
MLFKEVLAKWMRRYFSDEEAIIFTLLLAGFFFVIIFFSRMLAPFLVSLVVAFLLQGVVTGLQRLHLPRIMAVILAFSLFLGCLMAVLFWLLPLIWQQLLSLTRELPGMVRAAQVWFVEMQETYPQFLSQQHMNQIFTEASGELRKLGQWLVGLSLSSIPNLVAWLIYLILVPILVFFMLKDQEKLVSYVSSLMPEKRALISRVWREMDEQITNYIRGKVIEILIVAIATWAAFAWLGLGYAELLALMVGFSVLVPYIGAAVVTIPVALIALFQFGISSDFLWVMAVYGIIQALDGNVLVPLLFSEAVNLHPVSIILAVLVFGGLWGFWGVFFAIPLATLLKAIFNAWPKLHTDDEQAA